MNWIYFELVNGRLVDENARRRQYRRAGQGLRRMRSSGVMGNWLQELKAGGR